MVLEKIYNAILGVLEFLISLLPNLDFLDTPMVTGVLDIIGFGVWVIGLDLFMLIVANILFWSVVHFGWAMLVFLYDRIPFI